LFHLKEQHSKMYMQQSWCWTESGPIVIAE